MSPQGSKVDSSTKIVQWKQAVCSTLLMLRLSVKCFVFCLFVYFLFVLFCFLFFCFVVFVVVVVFPAKTIVVRYTRRWYPQTRWNRELPLCHESQAKIFLSSKNCQRLIMPIGPKNMYRGHTCTRMDISAHQNCVKMHLFLVCGATNVHVINVAPSKQRQLAACAGIICMRSLKYLVRDDTYTHLKCKVVFLEDITISCLAYRLVFGCEAILTRIKPIWNWSNFKDIMSGIGNCFHTALLVSQCEISQLVLMGKITYPIVNNSNSKPCGWLLMTTIMANKRRPLVRQKSRASRTVHPGPQEFLAK